MLFFNATFENGGIKDNGKFQNYTRNILVFHAQHKCSPKNLRKRPQSTHFATYF